ncbi:MAG: sulfatase-like hydrolase/transferase, partial [Myxococcota bacterium]
RFTASTDPQALEHLRDDPNLHYNRRRMIDKYDGAVAYVDSQVGRLLRRVDELGLAETTMVVLTADHGESLGEHGLHGHEYQIYEPLVRIPLIVRLPGLGPSRVAEAVEHVDILPTVLRSFGLSGDDSFDGGLLPLERGPADPGDVFAETWVRKVGRRAMVRSGRWKLIVNDPRFETDERPGFRSPRVELYDLDADPGELKNVASSERERRDDLERQLGDWMTDYTVKPLPIHVGQGELEMLRSLGYVE